MLEDIIRRAGALRSGKETSKDTGKEKGKRKKEKSKKAGATSPKRN
jgi:hypothetical protein